MKLKKSYTTPASVALVVKPQEMLCWSGGGEAFFFSALDDGLTGTRDNYGNASGDTNEKWY